MKSHTLPRVFIFALLALGSLCRDSAAAHFSYSSQVTTNASLPNQVTFSLFLTNTSGSAISDVRVTNLITGTITNATAIIERNGVPIPPFPGSANESEVSAAAGRVSFRLSTFAAGERAELHAVVLAPSLVGLSDTITISIGGESATLTASITDATNDGGGGGGGGGGGTNTAGDLGVTLSVPVLTNLFTGDQWVFRVTATNLGPGTVSNVILSNTLAGLTVVSLTPTQAFNTNESGNVVLTLGSLAAGAGQTFDFTVITTNAGTYNLAAAISAARNTDPNTANNTSAAAVPVNPTVSANATATAITAQTLNLQNGLMQEVVRVSNTSAATDIPAFRLTVLGLGTTNFLYNAVGTNNGNPFVVHPARVAAGGSVNLLLEYFNPRRQPITSRSFVVTELAPLTFATNYTGGANIEHVQLVQGGVLVQFPATIGQRYTILYSDDASFSNNVMRAVPSFTAQASWVQWVDTGPPKTISNVTDVRTRFYRVVEGQ